MIKLTSIGCTAILWFSALTLQAGEFDEQKLNNWHQWRGPQANGVAAQGKSAHRVVSRRKISSGRSLCPAAAVRRQSFGEIGFSSSPR